METGVNPVRSRHCEGIAEKLDLLLQTPKSDTCSCHSFTRDEGMQ